MKIHRSNASARKVFMRSEWLSLTLVVLLLLPLVSFATSPGAGTPLKVDYRAAVASLAGITYVVNTTDDPGSLINCTDKAKRCSLRDAIQKANAQAGDDTIAFAIPATDPGCDAATGRCTIALSSALPDLSTNINIEGPGADKLTV